MPLGYIYNWTGKVSSAYGTAGNWYNTNAGATATVAPGASDEALVVASGSINGPGIAYDLGLTGTGAGLSVGGTLYGSYDYVGGTVTLASGAAIASPNLIDIGDASSSAIAGKVPTVLTVGSGSFISATLATANTFDILVGQGGGSGTLAVTGTGIASAGTEGFWVGNGGIGLITVSGGAQVQAGTAKGSAMRQIDLALGSNGGNGALVVSGTNSLADFTNTVEAGFGGTGLISVTGGGELLAGEGLDALNIGDVYNGTAGTGVVNIVASTAYLAGIVEVGAYGQGSLNVSNGGFVDAYFYLPGTAPVWSALIGANAGSKGTLSLSTGATMLAAEGIAVGSSGTGELDVSFSTLSIFAQPAAGTVALDAGVGSGAVGTVNVSGGLIDDRGSAGMVIGGAGSGSLAITQNGSQGGTVLTGNSVSGVGLTVGASGGSTGSISISGAASGLGVSGEVADGAGGQGTIVLSAGAHLIAGLGDTATGLVLGGSGGSGLLNVTGAAQLVVTGQTDVAEFGSGTLSIIAGGGYIGTASGVSALVIAVSQGTTGSVLISDPYSYAQLNGGATVGSSGAGTLTVQNQALVAVLSATPTTASLPAVSIGAGAGSTGTFTLASGARLNATGGGVAVGLDGTGILSVDSATLTVAMNAEAGQSALNVGVDAGSSGTVNVTGGLFIDTYIAGMTIGDAGAGELSISQAGTVGGLVITGASTNPSGLAIGVASGATGNVVIDGSASGLADYGSAAIGSSGQGNVTVLDGGNLVIAVALTGTGVVLGGSGGQGTMVLETGAQAYVAGQSQIGQLGAGAVTITGGGSLTETATVNPAMVVGSSSTGTGSVDISDPHSYARLIGGLVVGSSGTGLMVVQNAAILGVIGSTASTQPGLILGLNTGGSGTLTVQSGAYAEIETGIAVGDGGSGELDVSSGRLEISMASSTEVPGLDAAALVGSKAVINITGGQVTDYQAEGVIIGDLGTATLTISQSGSQGGDLLVGNQTSNTVFVVGNQASATGSVSVSGSTSGLGVYGGNIVGASGVGSLSFAGGATFISGATPGAAGLVLGENTGGIGSVVLAGGSYASITGQTEVGEGGSGFLSIAGGSGLIDQATGAPALVVAGGSGSTGNVLVSDAGSYLSLTGGLEVGGAGYGTFTVANGALAASSGTLSVGAHGTVLASGVGSKLSAGAVANLGTITAGGGTLSFLGAVSGSGSLAISANGLMSLGSTEANAVSFGSGGGSLVVLSAADIGGTVAGWSSGDFIDLSTVAATSESFANGTLSLLGSGNQVLGTVAFSGALATHNFTLTALGGGGTSIGYHS